MRIVVAMSGGVDSSVAAALLASEGHDVVGLSMQLYDRSGREDRFGTCCTIEDLHDARRVAAALGIPHYLVNFERVFADRVVANFVQEYVDGRTPIPCTRCNSEVKFATLLDRSRALAADRLATGHYARVEHDAGRGRFVLRRGLDPDRDQSYFLFSLTQAQLSRASFPLGALTKRDVRARARALNLPVADKPDSQEICFIPDGDHGTFIDRALGDRAPRDGPIVDLHGRVLGRHAGHHRFTVGQRRGLGVSAPDPLYVLEIRPASQTVVVGARRALERVSFVAEEVNWIAGEPPAAPLDASVQIRHRHRPAAARVVAVDADRAEVQFAEPQPAVAPGQAAVFYDRDAVVGGGWIARS